MLPGQAPRVLAGKYRLVSKLDQGGMGSVWRAEHLTLHSPVAIKLIDPNIAVNPEAHARFMREAQAAAALRSPHVVQILDFGVDQEAPYIAMELLEGESLADRLARTVRLSPREAAHVMTHVARAIGRAHEAGIVHRDLKPENVFIIKNDEEEHAKVLDFGIAKSTPRGLGALEDSGTRTGALLGTPYYMSPEQAEGVRTVDHRTDIWTMGVLAFECITGRRPFDAETVGSLLLAICARDLPVPSTRAPVPPGFDAWFARCCARSPDDRFPTAKEAANALRAVCGYADESVETTNPGFALGAAPRSDEISHPLVTLNDAIGAGRTPAPADAHQFALTENALSLTEPSLPKYKPIRGALIALSLVGGVVVGGAALVWWWLRAPETPAAAASAPREVVPPQAPAGDAPPAAPEPVVNAAEVAAADPTPAIAPATASADPPAPPTKPVAAAKTVVTRPAKVVRPKKTSKPPASKTAPSSASNPRVDLGF
jgi:serine/threonine-protein kinase